MSWASILFLIFLGAIGLFIAIWFGLSIWHVDKFEDPEPPKGDFDGD